MVKTNTVHPSTDETKRKEIRELAEKIAQLPMQSQLVFAAAAEMAALLHDAKGA